jgi:fumarate reductase flavoprotein subunit
MSAAVLPDEVEEVEVDLAVAGGGACGLMTALRASENPDVVVAVFEKDAREGSNAAVSSGSLAAGGTRWQRDAGIKDSPEQHAEDILEQSGDERHRALVEALCAVAPEYVSWVAESGYALEVGVDMARKGMSVPRLHADPLRRGGGPLVTHLRGLLTARDNVALVDEAPVQSLRVSGSGHAAVVTGLTARQGGRRVEVSAGRVVLATDGFAGNADLMRRHCAALGEPFFGGTSTSTGDSVAWLEALGVDFRNMAACLRHGQVTVGHGTRVNPNLPWLGAVLVNTAGSRFVDEQSHGYSGLAGVIQAQPGERAAMIWDAEAQQTAQHSEMMRESAEAGAIRTAPDLAALAAALRIDPPELEESLRPLEGRRALQGPFSYAWLTHGVLTTQGGAAIDAAGRVLRPDGTAVEGLRAGGGVAVGLAGERSEGYSSGNGLLAAFGMGWIIGSEVAAG